MYTPNRKSMRRLKMEDRHVLDDYTAEIGKVQKQSEHRFLVVSFYDNEENTLRVGINLMYLSAEEIYKDKKRKTYYYSTYVNLPNGERKRDMKRGFKTKKEAKNAEIDFLYNFDIEDEENLSFEKIADIYLSWYKKRRKESSYTKIENVVRIHLKPFFGRKKIK